MINNSMNTGKIIIDPSQKVKTEKSPPIVVSKPNELGGIAISSSLKISDPNTKQIIVHKRADD
jgi:hypothetical protein